MADYTCLASRFEYAGDREVKEEGMRVRIPLTGVADIFPLSSGEASDTVPTFDLK